MGLRLDLQTLFETIIDSENVYFQPPPGYMMAYPCIVYSRSNIRTKFADNDPYLLMKQYSVTVIDANPDSDIPDKIAALPQCVFDRHFTSEALNHDVFNILF
ncbi:MAG: hypothetical protein A2201_03265 [Alicyclobacillus sp. RIFOXYA1_FULL_53_8]|nr:MAG: hypothetical protein A2201_03265 [Alicyclobacillus sp. RIFOXYA1_FULL_53_8]